jgi:hypothetical protein
MFLRNQGRIVEKHFWMNKTVPQGYTRTTIEKSCKMEFDQLMSILGKRKSNRRQEISKKQIKEKEWMKQEEEMSSDSDVSETMQGFLDERLMIRCRKDE